MAFVAPLFTSSFMQNRLPVVSQRPATVARRRAVMAPTMSGIEGIPNVLADILDRKAVEVAALRAEIESTGPEHPVAKKLEAKGTLKRKQKFKKALTLPKGTLTVIAEIKRRSPSKGQIATIKDPGMLSRIYHEGGAGAISVLTDLEGFGGTLADMERVVATQAKHEGNYPGPCPVLRKDFVIDELQIAQAAAHGASAILLIVAALGKEKTKELLQATHDLGLDALVEVHDEEELQIALDVGAEIVGVNNRDLRNFEVSLDTSFRLGKLMPDSIIKVAESGIADCLDAWKLRDAGFSAILVGESLVRAFESSSSDSTSYTVGYNQAKGLIKAFKAKGSVEYGSASAAAFYGKGEGAKEVLGELSI